MLFERNFLTKKLKLILFLKLKKKKFRKRGGGGEGNENLRITLVGNDSRMSNFFLATLGSLQIFREFFFAPTF